MAAHDDPKYFCATASATRRNATLAADSGLKSTAARLTLGATSLSSPNHLPLMAGSKFWNPVMLPPGRARLVTKPLPTASKTWANTIGTVRVNRCSSANAGLEQTTITAGAEPSNTVEDRNRPKLLCRGTN
jgi:hypothetical protein